jgi:hypothetical protein
VASAISPSLGTSPMTRSASNASRLADWTARGVGWGGVGWGGVGVSCREMGWRTKGHKAAAGAGATRQVSNPKMKDGSKDIASWHATHAPSLLSPPPPRP